MAMITPIDKIPIQQNQQNDTISVLNDPLVKEVINEIHNSQPVNQQQQPTNQQQPVNQQQQQQQPIYNYKMENPINISYINYEIMIKSIILAIIGIIVITFIPMDKINELIKTNEYEIIIKGIILSSIYYLYTINIK